MFHSIFTSEFQMFLNFVKQFVKLTNNGKLKIQLKQVWREWKLFLRRAEEIFSFVFSCLYEFRHLSQFPFNINRHFKWKNKSKNKVEKKKYEEEDCVKNNNFFNFILIFTNMRWALLKTALKHHLFYLQTLFHILCESSTFSVVERKRF